MVGEVVKKAPVEAKVTLKSKGVDNYTEVYQIIRTIGNPAAEPSAMSVEPVNALLGKMMAKGWVIHTATPMGVVPGGAILYYLLVR